jgi:hypothetical protein
LDKAVGIMTGCWLLATDRVQVAVGSRILSSGHPGRLWGSPSLLSSGYTCLQLVPGSRKHGTFTPPNAFMVYYLIKHRDNITLTVIIFIFNFKEPKIRWLPSSKKHY